MKTLWPEGLKGKELFQTMFENKAAIIEAKKATAHKFADMVLGAPKRVATASKAYAYANDESAGKLIRTIVMNTYNWLDSHDDVHQNNLFAKTIADKGDRIPHLHDHEFKITARVGIPISWTEKAIAWKELGVELDGDTMCLLCESEIQKELNKPIYKAYLTDQVDQHSVKMQYVRLDMAINDPDYVDEYKAWQETFPKLGNKELALEQNYYFAIHEAKCFEGSCVIAGSNELTPTLKFQPPVGTGSKPELVPLDIDKMVRAYM